jgi:nitrogen fixation/metabolism regulation signal transduction histidine kinase
MDIRALVKRIASPGPVITVSAIILLVLCLVIVNSLEDDSSGQLQILMTLVGAVGITLLVFFIAVNCYALYRQVKRGEAGSKLSSKFVLVFLALTIIPFSLVYFFSIQFLNRGVDSWFDVRIEQAIEDAFLLGQSSLEAINQEFVNDLEDYAANLPINAGRLETLRALEEIRLLEDYVELSLYTVDGRIIAFSSGDAEQLLPSTPVDEVFSEIAINQTYTSLEPLSNTTQQLRIVAPVAAPGLGQSLYALQAIKLLPLRYGILASNVEKAYRQYDQMVFARGPLKFSLILTLTIISLISFLFSILAALYLSRRLAAPIGDLAAGTAKIADGDYKTTLPVTSNDELGDLVASFNDMSQRIQKARNDVEQSRQLAEDQRSYLETILRNLSSGVFTFDPNNKLILSNSIANDIIGLNAENDTGMSIEQFCQQNSNHQLFFEAIQEGINSGKANWQREVNLLGAHGRQMIIMQGTELILGGEEDAHHIVVFDDVTDLIQAQRDAAWGEVARRLAHEIKNPLTPIQLSAERIQNKFVQQLPDESQEALSRSARTIVQQVESMKDMVNAFASYAQPVRAKLEKLDINDLIEDVMDLHASTVSHINVKLDLDGTLPMIKANKGALRQVLNNLVINAGHALQELKASSEVGTEELAITLSSSRAQNIEGDYIDLQVIDNGIGIPETVRDRLFDPYVSTKAKGSGLGLAIVRRIVEEHGGSVWSEPANPGTKMIVRLPINVDATFHGVEAQNDLQSAEKS